MSHIGHKYNNVQADGRVALRCFESRCLWKQQAKKKTKLMKKIKSSNITDYTQSAWVR
jgi:hypothetical protein